MDLGAFSWEGGGWALEGAAGDGPDLVNKSDKRAENNSLDFNI